MLTWYPTVLLWVLSTLDLDARRWGMGVQMSIALEKILGRELLLYRISYLYVEPRANLQFFNHLAYQKRPSAQLISQHAECISA